MKQHILDIVREVFITQMNHVVFASFGMLLMAFLQQEDAMFWYWMLLSLLPLWNYFLRRKVKNVLLFLILHIPFPVACALAPVGTGWFRVPMTAIAVIYVIWSIVIKYKGAAEEEETFQPLFVIGSIGASSIISEVFGAGAFNVYYLALVFYFLALYFVHAFIDRYQNFLVVNQYSASNIPEKEIFSVGLTQTGVYTAIGLGVLFLSANIEWLAYLLKGIGYGLLTIIRVLLVWLAGDAPDELPPEEEVLPGNDGGDFGMTAEGEPFILWKILEYILIWALTAAIIAAILYGIYKLIRFILNNFKEKHYEEGAMNSGIDVREAVAIEKSEKGSMRLFRFKDNRDKVRKTFKKIILKEKKQILGELEQDHLHYLTAGECCDKLDAAALKCVYEKARYTEDEITAVDLRQLKDMTK